MKTKKNLLFTICLISLAATVLTSACKKDDSYEKLFAGLQLSAGYKELTDHNPIAVQRFGADPYAMEYDGRVYVYMTNDLPSYDENGNIRNNNYGNIHKIFCVSSADLVNWTDHGAMNVAGSDGTAKWAGCSWAPTACHKTIDGKERFFLYFANGGNGIGVVAGDTPYGPWEDVRGDGLITRQTPTCNTVTWLFDPAVLVDDDGCGYIYFGGGVPRGKHADPGTARVAKLTPDMTAIEGEPLPINPPYLFEDAGANKIGDTYYYSYCTNFNCPTPGNGMIAYMTSKKPMGPFKYVDAIFDNPGKFFGTGGNNHHAICRLGDNYYLFYHAQTLQDKMGIKGGYRSTHVDEVAILPDGTIGTVTGTYKGVEQFCALNPFTATEAETMAWMGGIETRYINDSTTNLCVTAIDNGDWIGLSGVDFGDGAASIEAVVASKEKSEGAIKICLDAPDGEAVGYIGVRDSGGEFVTVRADLLKKVTGTHHLFFVFAGNFEFDRWQMIRQ